MDFKYKTESLNKKIIDLDTEILEIIYPNIKILNEIPKYQWYKTFEDLRRLSLDEIIYITDKIITNKKDIVIINNHIDKMKKLYKKLANIMLKMKKMYGEYKLEDISKVTQIPIDEINLMWRKINN